MTKGPAGAKFFTKKNGLSRSRKWASILKDQYIFVFAPMEFQRLQKKLADVMDKKHIAEWLQTPNSAFENLTPLEVIERGEIDRIWRMIFYIESGMVV